MLVIALFVAVLGGCGDDDSSGSSGNGDSAAAGSRDTSLETSDLSKAQFIKQAEKICARESEDLLTLIIDYIAKNKPKPGQTEGEVTAEGVHDELIPKFQAQVDKIEELGAPAGDEAEIEAFLAAMQKAIFTLERRNEVNLETDIDREFEDAGELALDYGLISCAN